MKKRIPKPKSNDGFNQDLNYQRWLMVTHSLEVLHLQGLITTELYSRLFENMVHFKNEMKL